MDKSDLKFLYKNLKKYSNNELNQLTIDILNNNNKNDVLNKFSNKYNSTELVNGINKINFKLYGGEEPVMSEPSGFSNTSGIDEAAELKVSLSEARNKIETLKKENQELRAAGADAKSIMKLRQSQAQENAKLAESRSKNREEINKLSNIKKQADLSKRNAENMIARMNEAKKNADESLKKLKAAEAKISQQRAAVKEADTKAKADMAAVKKAQAILAKNEKKLEKLNQQHLTKQRNLEELEKVTIGQQKRAEQTEKQAESTLKRVEQARTKLKLQSQDFNKNKEDAIKAIQVGMKKYKSDVEEKAKFLTNSATEVETQLINSLKAISKIRTK